MQDEEVLGKAYDARLMRRLVRYLRPYRRQVLLAFLLILFDAALETIPPLLTMLAIDRYIPASDLSGLGGLAVFYLLALAGSFAFEFIQTTTLQMIGQRIMYDVRMQVYTHLQRLGLRFYDRNPVGRLMTRVTTDVDVIYELFASGVVTMLADFLTLAFIIGTMFYFDWRLTLTALAAIPLIVLVTAIFRRSYRDANQRSDLLVGQRPQLRQIRQQRRGQHGPYPGHAAQQFIFLAPNWTLLDRRRQIRVRAL